MPLGDGMAPETKIGPLVAEAQRTRVAFYVDGSLTEGATLVTGGARPEDPALASGFFYEPTVLDGVTPEMRIGREEVFGPVLTVGTFESEQEAVEKANSTEFGLWAGIWTRDVRRVHALAARIEAGIVTANEEPVTFPQTPFGGFKMSGSGSEQGMDAVLSYLRTKNVSVNLD